MEVRRLKNEFSALYNGNPWIDVTIKDTLSEVTWEKAFLRIAPGRNSIFEIINHVTRWRELILQRLQGKTIPAPADNFFSKHTDPSETAWNQAITDFEASQHQWIKFLDDLEDAELEKTYASGKETFYYYIQGIIQHDAYHLGQIVLLNKLSY